jgi:hypothetical protein
MAEKIGFDPYVVENWYPVTRLQAISFEVIYSFVFRMFLFYFILFYFILFYFILFYFILFYFILFIYYINILFMLYFLLGGGTRFELLWQKSTHCARKCLSGINF